MKCKCLFCYDAEFESEKELLEHIDKCEKHKEYVKTGRVTLE